MRPSTHQTSIDLVFISSDEDLIGDHLRTCTTVVTTHTTVKLNTFSVSRDRDEALSLVTRFVIRSRGSKTDRACQEKLVDMEQYNRATFFNRSDLIQVSGNKEFVVQNAGSVHVNGYKSRF